MKTTLILFYLKILYAVLVLIVLSLMAYYVRGLTSKGGFSGKARAFFYAWVVFLAAAGITFHLLTAQLIPWVPWELRGDKNRPRNFH